MNSWTHGTIPAKVDCGILRLKYMTRGILQNKTQTRKWATVLMLVRHCSSKLTNTFQTQLHLHVYSSEAFRDTLRVDAVSE